MKEWILDQLSLRQTVPVIEGNREATEAEIHKQEHLLYTKALQQLLQ